MRSIDIVAAGAVSPLGTGRSAFSVGEVGEPARTAVVEDRELAEAGLRRPVAARAPAATQPGDRATGLLRQAARELRSDLDAAWPGWRGGRAALAIGTTSGGMLSFLDVLSGLESGRAPHRPLAQAAPYFGPLDGIEGVLGIDSQVCVQVLGACASSTIALGIGCLWLDLDCADVVVAGGYDAVSVFVAAGFEAIGATTATRPAPFRIGRDGMALGEGAALVALVRNGAAPVRPLAHVLGFGLSSDAVHVTAPDRTGGQLARAGLAALIDGGIAPDAVGVVSGHATATPYNDAAEAKAIRTVLGTGHRAIVHPYKAVIGHTLGAAGILESLSAVDAMRAGVLPAAAGAGPLDPAAAVPLLRNNTAGHCVSTLKLSSAFGGANAALVLSLQAGGGVERFRNPVDVVGFGEPCERVRLDRRPTPPNMDARRIARLDPVSGLAVTATAACADHFVDARPDRVGVILATMAATLEENQRFDERRRALGARFVEPRRFPATSPNLSCGQCTIAYGLRGASFAVGGGLAAPVEALIVAHDLVAAGELERAVVIAVDDVGSVVEGIWTAAGWPVPRHGAAALVLGRSTRTGISRERLVRRYRDLRMGGTVGVELPGWPSLLAAVREART